MKYKTLSQKQGHFAFMVGRLLAFVDGLPGYYVTFGDAYSKPAYCEHMPDSLHFSRLAVDLNLFVDGEYRPETEAYLPLGLFWESIGGSWGGRFKDGNHFSLSHNGKK